MNRRIIKKVLNKKHKDFCASIKDEKVRDLVEKNSFITGGSIVSMLLNEPISDFDYYFTDFETVKAVAEYYVHEFIELKSQRNDPCKIEPEVLYETKDNQNRVKIGIRSVGIAAIGADDSDYEYFEQGPESKGMDFVEKQMDALNDMTDSVEDD
jgi:hypothetical protein